MDQIHHSSLLQTSSYSEAIKMMNRHRVLVDVLIGMFGISAWIGVNGIYVQLPLLVASAPEGWSLPAYIVILVQAANLCPVLYTLFRKFAPRLCNESIWIFSLLVIGSTAMGLLAFSYDVKTIVNGVEHSIALLILTFATAIVGCSSSILFVPYLRNFREVHLVSFFVGEGLSLLISSAVVLVQGIGSNPVCENTLNSTDPKPPVVSGPHFSPRVYFLIIFVTLVTSTGAFWLLNHMLNARNQRLSSSEDATQDSNFLDEKFVRDRMIFSGQTSDPRETVDQESTSSYIHSRGTRVYLYVLMGFICLLSNGFLPGMQSYSCLPYGNSAYSLAVALANLSNPIACLLALWLPSSGLRGISVVAALAVVAASHVTWLAFSSPAPLWRDTTHGAILVVIVWVILTGLVTYAKLSITAIFRQEPGAKSLFYVGIVTQAGSATGAIFTFFLINYTNLLVPYNACEPPL